MWLLTIAGISSGLFAGAAIYVTTVEHPARLSCGTEVALREFAPSYHRAAILQAALAVLAFATGVWSAWLLGDTWVLSAAVLVGSVVPFTLLVILPVNRQLLSPSLDPLGGGAAELLSRWGRLHALRSVAGAVAFVIFLVRLAQ